MNTVWNYEARCILRDKRRCVAVIDGDCPCERAEKLNETLGHLNVNFFSGLSITAEDHNCGVLLCHKAVEDACGNLLKTPWKYLEYDWRTYRNIDCILGQFILRLMLRSLTLEQLVIKSMPPSMELKDKSGPEGAFELPRLKFIQVPDFVVWHFHDLLSDLMSRAPSIEELGNVVEARCIPEMPAEILRIVKKLQIQTYVYSYDTRNAIVTSLDKFCESQATLTSLVADLPRIPYDYYGNFQRMMQGYFDRLTSIITSSSDTLRDVKLDSIFMYMSLRTQPFPVVMKNVENLAFAIHGEDDAAVARYLMRMPLAEIFPSVVSVKFSTDKEKFRLAPSIEPQEEDQIFPCPFVKEAKFKNSVSSDLVIKELGILCPHLCRLELCFLDPTRTSSSSIPFRQIWSSVPHLETLTVQGSLETVGKNYDAEFCGIHRGEAALLRKEDAELLKSLSIVSPFVPIMNMKSKEEYPLQDTHIIDHDQFIPALLSTMV